MEYKNYDDEIVENIFSSLSIMHEAAWYLLDNYTKTDIFNDLTGNMLTLTANSEIYVLKLLGKDHCLSKTLENIKATVTRLINGQYSDRMEMKIQYELVPLIEEAYLYTRYYLWAVTSAERMAQYKEEIPELCANKYILEYEKTDEYKYEVTFVVTGYNKLKYTKMCVESLLENIPEGLNYEIILVNHGSTDSTYEYYESIKPTKQLDLMVNGGGWCSVLRIVQAKYVFFISNDVIIGANAIENLLTCIKSDPSIAWVVPSTSNISNLQSIPANYNTDVEFKLFTEKNNISDQYRWEQRTRLVNPIDVKRIDLFYGSNGVFPNSFFEGVTDFAFPDDMVALLLRHRNYKMMLAKDSYCHHFGSVTINNDVKQAGGNDMFLKGRVEFKKTFGIDPWGLGFCYDPIFINKIVDKEKGHIDILGINCGCGSNSLKIKEQFKEYYHNVDTFLFNVTDDSTFLLDLNGISDCVQLIQNMGELETFFEEHKFDYIVWDAPFVKFQFSDVIKKCIEGMKEHGKIILHFDCKLRELLKTMNLKYKQFDKNWLCILKP